MLSCPAQDPDLCAAILLAAKETMSAFMMEDASVYGRVPSPGVHESDAEAFVQVGAMIASTLVSRVPCGVATGYLNEKFLQTVIYTDDEPDEATAATRRGLLSVVPPGFLAALRAVSIPQDIGLRVNGVRLIQ